MAQPFDENTAKGPPASAVADAESWLQTVQTLVESLKHGTVQIVIQDSRVVQINSTEKVRFDHPQPKATGNSGRRRGSHHGR